MLKACIFDMDGTLLESMGAWMKAGDTFLEELGIVPEKNLGAKVILMSAEETADYMNSRYGVNLTPQKIIDLIQGIMKREYTENIQLKPFAREFLEFLNKKKIPCAILTNTPGHIFKPAIERLGLAKYFKLIYACPDFNTSKDEPEIFYKCVHDLGAESKDCAVFEDALYAIKTAESAGFTVFGMKDESASSYEKEIKQCADFYCSSFEELMSPSSPAASLFS